MFKNRIFARISYEIFKISQKEFKIFAINFRIFSIFGGLAPCSASLTMTQQRFNHVLIPHVYKEKLDQLDLNSICSDFIAKNQSRKAFFGHE